MCDPLEIEKYLARQESNDGTLAECCNYFVQKEVRAVLGDLQSIAHIVSL
jgi:hypothetical protein